jgi:hypothetical protein
MKSVNAGRELIEKLGVLAAANLNRIDLFAAMHLAKKINNPRLG